MNCIQEGLIPSKYFEKSTERLVSANGTQMKIKYELNNAHVCHDNVCFKIQSILVKNMTDKVILGLPFINALYPFLVEHDGITTDPFGQKVKFRFASKFEIDTDNALNLIHAKINHLNFLEQEVRCKIIAEQLSERKNKGKAPAQSYPQDKRLPVGQPFVMHEGVSSGVKPSRSISLQEFFSTEFHNGLYSELPNSVKFILDNLQAGFTQKHQNLFKKTFQALEIHLVNLTTQNEIYASHYANLVSENWALKSHLVNHPNVTNEPYTSQLFGKEEIHSMDKKTIMGTDYARLSLKTQSLLRSAVANLPTEIQFSILESKAMFRSFDQWYKHFKKLVTVTIPDPDDLDVDDNVFIQLNWEEHFGSSLRVYEKKHPFLGLLINYEDGIAEEDRDPNWLSQMFEYGFISFIKLTSHDQISQFPQIIQNVVSQINSPYISIRCWSTFPKWKSDNWMNV
ncbi:hypothetical protein SO802_021396 [Lithocarpus litseifolius]|uniref:Uncharacterized protein n=1 Tax=Lithocarpus litseifolius TaxID=425828 RepID=A0AAW2CER0_9ROSI